MALLLLIIAQLQNVSATELKAQLRPQAKPLVVHVWASWCAPCVSELGELAARLRKRAGRVDAIMVNLDESAAKAEKLAARLGKLRSVRAATPEAMATLRALDEKWEGELPGTWLIAPDGRVILSQRGVSDLRALWNAIDTGRGP